LEPVRSIGTTTYRGALKEDGATLYRSGSRDKVKSPVSDQSGSGNPDHRVIHPDVLRDEGGSSQRLEWTEEYVVMVGSWPCKVSSEIHING
jgi:hypothetical protein